MIIQAVAPALIAFADTIGMLLVAAAVFGLSVGNLLMLQPPLIAEAFGVEECSRGQSLNQLFGTIGVAISPFVSGLLHDWSNYETAFLFGSAANVIGLVALVLAGSTSVPSTMWNQPATIAAAV